MMEVRCVVHLKYGPEIEDHGPQRYYCQAYPCPNLTTLFYRPSNSMLCQNCIDKRKAKP